MSELIQVYADELLTSEQTGSAVTTVGTFDGVHLGHQQILSRLSAHNMGKWRRTVVTFEPHPQIALHNRLGIVPILTTITEKMQLLRSAKVDRVFILKFTPELAQLSAEDFLTKILLGLLNTTRLVVGYNHSFGRDRQGNLEFLKQVSDRYNFEVDAVEPHLVAGEVISSSKIRKALLSGDLARANRYLGRPYFISGEVVPGQRRGRELRFPTANLKLLHPEKLLPPNGVYAVAVKALGQEFPGMLNIGTRPTFSGETEAPVTFEVHLIGFKGDLYGKTLGVFFLQKLREERKFNNIEELISQMSVDQENSLQFYRKYQSEGSSLFQVGLGT